jgi:hypothetical protein
LTNNGSGGFALVNSLLVGPYPISVAAADVNGDGKVDLITVNFGGIFGGGNTLTVLTNNGKGGFAVSSSPQVGNDPTSVTTADMNGDGRVDLISANSGSSSLSILLNTLTFVGNFTGNFSSPRWAVTTVFTNAIGGLPLSTTFNSNGGTLVIAASGSGYATSANNTIGMEILVDGSTIGNCSVYMNVSSQHAAFVPTQIVLRNVTAGTHTLTLVNRFATATDIFDLFNVLVTELPF